MAFEGLTAGAKNIGQGIVNKVKGAFAKSTTFDYNANRRTYVLNDFSIVSKANIWVFYNEYQTLTKKDKIFTPISKLEVQINPCELEVVSGLTPQSLLESVKKEDGTSDSITYDYLDQSEVSIPTLLFDIYDEYIARTGGGSGLGGQLLNGSTFEGNTGLCNSFSLANEKITALAPLIKYSKGSGSRPYHLYFQWGDMEYFGEFREITVRYTAFSSTGCPLRATADIKLRTSNVPQVSQGNASWHSWIKSKIIQKNCIHPVALSF